MIFRLLLLRLRWRQVCERMLHPICPKLHVMLLTSRCKWVRCTSMFINHRHVLVHWLMHLFVSPIALHFRNRRLKHISRARSPSMSLNGCSHLIVRTVGRHRLFSGSLLRGITRGYRRNNGVRVVRHCPASGPYLTRRRRWRRSTVIRVGVVETSARDKHFP